MGEIFFENRLVKADTFPMGIDYKKFNAGGLSKGVEKEKIKLRENIPSLKLILSIDRQDYSKGILNRLKGYELFLQSNPQWKKMVTMLIVVIPSRIGVESYQAIKSQVDELVGRINGTHGGIDWMPIIYQYRSLTFDELMAMYSLSDVALVTPLRDGMNLIAKEYVAARTDSKGVLILSEMAGSVDELDESIIINPNNIEEIGDALLQALEMKESEQKLRIEIMQKRVMNYDVFKWVDDFLSTLNYIKLKQKRLSAKLLNQTTRKKMIDDFKKSASRILFLDYDGTLVPHIANPAVASPGKDLLSTLQSLVSKNDLRIVIVSGRDKATLENWFGHLKLDFIAEHGIFLKEHNEKWTTLKPLRKNWMKKIKDVMNQFIEKLPGAFVEEKEYSLVFHYRKSDFDHAELRVKELMNYLESFTSNMDVQMLIGDKVLEVRNSGIDKGIAAMHWLSKVKKYPRFVLAIGNDRTDEDLFRAMPSKAYTIKVGFHQSFANYNLYNSGEVINLLKEFL